MHLEYKVLEIQFVNLWEVRQYFINSFQTRGIIDNGFLSNFVWHFQIHCYIFATSPEQINCNPTQLRINEDKTNSYNCHVTEFWPFGCWGGCNGHDPKQFPCMWNNLKAAGKLGTPATILEGKIGLGHPKCQSPLSI